MFPPAQDHTSRPADCQKKTCCVRRNGMSSGAGRPRPFPKASPKSMPTIVPAAQEPFHVVPLMRVQNRIHATGTYRKHRKVLNTVTLVQKEVIQVAISNSKNVRPNTESRHAVAKVIKMSNWL